MMTAKLNVASRFLAACFLASSCVAGIVGQAPSTPVFGPVFNAVTGPGYLQAVSTNGCVAGNDCTNNGNVWVTNFSATRTNGELQLTFTIAGGSNGLAYDVFIAP